MLAAGPLIERKRYDFAAAEAARTDDLDITEVGRHAAALGKRRPPLAHRDRVGRNGAPCRWDGRILADVIDRILASDRFGEPDWNSRSVVEICGQKKADGWFFHAITGEEWLLKMKFRTARNTFRRDELIASLDLKPLNDMPDLPLYGTEARVRCKNLHGPWQEIEVRVHTYQEIDRPEFWKFIDAAVAGFGRFTERVQQNPEDLMPWKVLGRKWHFARRVSRPAGPSSGNRRCWKSCASCWPARRPPGQFLWNNKQVVPVYVAAHKEPWAALQTKKTDAVYLHLTGPKGRFALAASPAWDCDPALDGQRPDVDVVRLRLASLEEVQPPTWRPCFANTWRQCCRKRKAESGSGKPAPHTCGG